MLSLSVYMHAYNVIFRGLVPFVALRWAKEKLYKALPITPIIITISTHCEKELS